MDKAGTIVCLVGENPLPVYLGAHQFADEQCTVVLIHSNETLQQAERITRQLVADGIKNTRLVKLVEPYAARRVTELLNAEHQKYPHAWLNYTGGTKVMSAFAVKTWNDDRTVFYLDEAAGKFRFGCDTETELKGDIVDIARLCALHGSITDTSTKNNEIACINLDKLEELFSVWISRHDTNSATRSPFMPDNWDDFHTSNKPQELWERFTRDLKGFVDIDDDQIRTPLMELQRCFEQASSKSTDLRIDAAAKRWESFQLEFQLFQNIDPPGSKSKYQIKSKNGRYYRFAGTGWQEQLVRLLANRCTNTCWQIGTNFQIEGQPFEADLISVLNNRLYYISCTTETKESGIKAKAFEAVYRARQIGGGLARVAVVSFANDDASNRARASLTGVPRLSLFGITDVESWIAGDMDSFKRFSDS